MTSPAVKISLAPDSGTPIGPRDPDSLNRLNARFLCAPLNTKPHSTRHAVGSADDQRRLKRQSNARPLRESPEDRWCCSVVANGRSVKKRCSLSGVQSGSRLKSCGQVYNSTTTRRPSTLGTVNRATKRDVLLRSSRIVCSAVQQVHALGSRKHRLNQWRNNRACKACSARGPSAVGGPKIARRCF